MTAGSSIASKRRELIGALCSRLNGLCGAPRQISRADDISKNFLAFEENTQAFLSRWEQYLSPESEVPIIGCGSGPELKWFSSRVRSVTAVDVDADCIAECAAILAALQNVGVHLVPPDSLPFASARFDVVFMCNVCEHILCIAECFREYYRVLKPGGLPLNTFGPLFYSPFGAHMFEAIKFPWAHLLFGINRVLEIRNRYYPGTATAKTWEELGLNRLTEHRYRSVAKTSGFEIEYYCLLVSKDLPLVSRIPAVRNLFIHTVESVLRKPSC